MRIILLLLAMCIAFVACDKEDNENSYPPSVINFEIQTYGDLTAEGTVFGSKQTLSRTNKDYAADGEQNVLGILSAIPDDNAEVITIYGWGSGTDSPVEQLWFRIPDKGEGTYTFDPDTSSDKHFWFDLKTTYKVSLLGGNHSGSWVSHKTEMTVVISEISEERIKGSFSAHLVYFDINSSGVRDLNEEITNVNQPIINGTFDVFRFE